MLGGPHTITNGGDHHGCGASSVLRVSSSIYLFSRQEGLRCRKLHATSRGGSSWAHEAAWLSLRPLVRLYVNSMSCSVPRLRGHHLRPLSLNLGPVFQGTFRFFCAALHVIQIAQLRIGGPQVPPVSLNLDLAHANLENNVYGSGEYFAFDARLARYFQRQTRNKDRRSLEAHETWAICHADMGATPILQGIFAIEVRSRLATLACKLT